MKSTAYCEHIRRQRRPPNASTTGISAWSHREPAPHAGPVVSSSRMPTLMRPSWGEF
jgi:hypothetical protein